jgi:hypothetical protein
MCLSVPTTIAQPSNPALGKPTASAVPTGLTPAATNFWIPPDIKGPDPSSCTHVVATTSPPHKYQTDRHVCMYVPTQQVVASTLENLCHTLAAMRWNAASLTQNPTTNRLRKRGAPRPPWQDAGRLAQEDHEIMRTPTLGWHTRALDSIEEYGPSRHLHLIEQLAA